MNLKETSKPYQLEVQKGFILQLPNEGGVVEMARIASSPTKLNQKDEQEGFGNGLYLDVLNGNTRPGLTLSLGEGRDANGIWIAYRETITNPLSLQQTLEDCNYNDDSASYRIPNFEDLFDVYDHFDDVLNIPQLSPAADPAPTLEESGNTEPINGPHHDCIVAREHDLDVGRDFALGDGDSGEQLLQLLSVPDSQLEAYYIEKFNLDLLS